MTKSKPKPKGHTTCCKQIKRPNTPDALAELYYPPSEPSGATLLNRIQNPIQNKWPFHTTHIEKGWWFPVKPTWPLLDGSGDGADRGTVLGNFQFFAHPPAKKVKGYAGVCFNAASYKKLKYKGTEYNCGFTWAVKTVLERADKPSTVKNKTPDNLYHATVSGWLPLAALHIPAATRAKIEATLSDGRCCADNYGKWGRHLATGAYYPCKFLSNTDVESRLKAITSKNLSDYFVELPKDQRKTKTTILELIQTSAKTADVLRDFHTRLCIVPSASAGHFGDYLPSTSDYKQSKKYPGEGGYTYVCVNVSRAGKRPGSAPIALDVFPAHFTFHRTHFKHQKHVLSPVYKAPPKGSTSKAPLIGYAVWCFGYAVKEGSKSDRSYGWVPALALS